jgi:ATP-dependent Clp protease ATP-binding subunit ClpA
VTFGPRTKTVLTLAVGTARTLGQGRVGSEHLLLALVEGGGSPAAEWLAAAGVPLAEVRRETEILTGAAPYRDENFMLLANSPWRVALP